MLLGLVLLHNCVSHLLRRTRQQDKAAQITDSKREGKEIIKQICACEIDGKSRQCKVETILDFYVCIIRNYSQNIFWPSALCDLKTNEDLSGPGVLRIHVSLLTLFQCVSLSSGRKKRIKKWPIFWSPNSQDVWRRRVSKRNAVTLCSIKVSTCDTKLAARFPDVVWLAWPYKGTHLCRGGMKYEIGHIFLSKQLIPSVMTIITVSHSWLNSFYLNVTDK